MLLTTLGPCVLVLCSATETMQEFDVGIVGLGALGSSAAYHAAAKGARVIGFEQFELGHVHGASHDTSRIVRTSYDVPEYVALAKSAYKDWASLEQATGLKLLDITGGVVFLPRKGKVTAANYTNALEANNVPYELLTPAQVKQRWPKFSVSEGIDTVYCADTGIAHAARTVTAMQYLARSYGAVLKDRTPVMKVTPQGDQQIIIHTSSGDYRVRKVILAADAWTNKILTPLGATIPLRVSQEQITYFKPSEPAAYEPPQFPVWMWSMDHSFYGFPCYGEPSIKAGRHCGENWMTPENRTYVPSEELLSELKQELDKFMPDQGRQVLRTVTCQYTLTEDQNFIMSPLREYRDIIVGLGSAHAFKFCPVIGRVLAELAIDGKTQEDLSLFGIKDSNEPLSSKL